MPDDKPCKDCDPDARRRPAPYPGPRCATHHRERAKAVKARAHETTVARVYGLAPGEYELLYRYQGGRCWICQQATGARKRLAVDHDHATGEPRGLLCSRCNRFVGLLRDSSARAERLARYLAGGTPYRSLRGDSV